MNFETINKSIRTHINHSTLGSQKIAFPNIEFTIPDPPSPFIRLSIKHGDTALLGCGLPKYQRSIGVVIMQVFVPEGQGDKLALQIVDEICTVLDNVDISTVRFQSTRVKEVGVAGGFYQLNTLTPFTSDKVTQ